MAVTIEGLPVPAGGVARGRNSWAEFGLGKRAVTECGCYGGSGHFIEISDWRIIDLRSEIRRTTPMDVADSYGECFVQGFNVRLDPKMRLIL
jgi:hypothetical protein